MNDRIRPGPRWLQFSIRTLLAVTLVATSYFAGWAAANRRAVEAEKRARWEAARAVRAEELARRLAAQATRSAARQMKMMSTLKETQARMERAGSRAYDARVWQLQADEDGDEWFVPWLDPPFAFVQPST